MRDLPIAYGHSSHAKKWSNKTTTFDDLCERLKTTIRTPESVEEYAKMKSKERETAKDHGGFVCGALTGGRRLLQNVASRSMVNLDGDRVTADFVDGYDAGMKYRSCLYSTHGHVPEAPRVRILIPLTRDVTAEEYVAISRYVAEELGIDMFDECSYLPNQMMYWPSTPSNGEYLYLVTDGDWLNPDDILSAHPEWTDPARLPTSSRESEAKGISDKKQADPLEKDGIVGMFNNAYFPVNLAIDEFLGDVYELSADGTRYRFKESSSQPGVEIKEGGKFVYSHHAKDPAYLKLCSAFDIVRIHLFGDEDEKKSFRAMADFASKDEKVKMLILEKRQQEAETDFDITDEDDSWKKKLEYEPRSTLLKNSLHNITLIMENDPNLKGIVFNQLADGMEIKGEVPWKHPARFWRDADDAQLISFVDSHYGSFSERNYRIAVTKVTDDRSYHPIREMFESLPPWDKVERAETVLIDYLGAEDNRYVRAVTRKSLCAAYMRVHNPGIKFDTMIVLNGAQGIGKSTLIACLGGEWFSDSLALSDMNDKTAAEKLQGYWILEIGELAGMKKADIDKVKAFISRQDDKYRASFGRRVTPHPRQCVFFGTTNSENGYLRDITGNRRFWNVKVTGQGKYKPWDMTNEVVQQIWAEVAEIAKAGEKLYLDADLEAFAKQEQREAMEQDDREGIVRNYLDMLLPDNWDSMDYYRRREYIRDIDDPTRMEGTVKRQTVSNIEIWCECFGKSKEEMFDSFEVHKALVVAPLRVARFTWSAEIEKWEHLSGLQYSVAVGTEKERLEALQRQADIYIINRENVQWLIEKSGVPFDFDMVVIDELSSFKNHQAKRFRSLMKVRPKVKRIVGLTGTPSSNGLMDLWAEFRLLDMGQRLGRFIGQYRTAYFKPDKVNGPIIYSYKPLPDAEKQIYGKISDITISMKSTDHLKMPELVSSKHTVYLSEDERKRYEDMKAELILQLPEGEVTAANAAALSGKLSQMANGAVYSDDESVVKIHDRKLDALEDIIESANGKPLLVAYWYKHDLERITARLTEIRVPFAKLDTDSSIRRWNARELPVALIHPASAGHGLNLQSGGSTIVWFGLTWSLELYQQTNARLWRQGQTAGTVVVQHIIAEDTIDGRIMKALSEKDSTQSALIEAVKADLQL